MQEDPKIGTKSQLAISIAQGISVRKWALASNVPPATAYRWSKEPQVRKMAEACRRRFLDRAVGMMVQRGPWAVNKVIGLATGAESESVRLRALKTLFSDMMAVSRYAGLEDRMTQIEERLDERAGDSGQAG
jgi:hypothetical protein